jgi:hypothetical protein
MSKLLATLKTFDDLLKTVPDTEKRLASLYTYLRASETQLLDLFNAASRGKKHVAPPENAEGDLEFGLVLYWLEHPTHDHVRVLLADPALAIATQALVRFAPRSRIMPKTFTSFFNIAYNTGFVAADGTLYTPGKYAQLDALWLTAAANYSINLLDPKSIYHPFPSTPFHTSISPGKKSITVAIIGDWGTGAYDSAYAGNGPAVAVMNAVRNLKPDYVVHLGDVYYCGTDDRRPQHEEQTNLLDQWKTGTGAKTCFTLNSNHEMYGAAQGLIGGALTSGTPFAHQNSTTYFGLEFGNWVILGLDSAYFDSSMLYMKGALSNASNTQQRDFVSKNYGDLSNKQVLVMTHHNPMSFDGNSMTDNGNLWNDMLATLGGTRPYAWYWGHLHLGVVYNDKSAVGANKTLGRCVGHSAIPFGNASGMNADNVDYYAHTNVGIGTKQVQNGFAVVTLGANGSLAEAFYEIDAKGRCMQAWTKS